MPETMTPNVEAALNNFIETLWNEGLTTKGMVIQVPFLDEPFDYESDYGVVSFKDVV
jgi:hypothetical protein